ncbi:helix-turn-helix domain-containing protein [Streptomyces sp. NBC_01260]|uniref:PucR family transcriptional regulator n=1 Tax=Streptomyces sp. NBC_01260 TaxID=2903801 RepID=UPI002E2EE50A|nr:helix-turn-helix domain-containing protein [Streptomyces sp. NBC_01260]
MRQSGEERGWALLDALLDDDTGPGLPALAAAVLGLPEAGRYAVAVLPLRGRPCPTPRTAGAHGLRFLWRARPDREIAVVALGEADPAAVVTLLADLGPGPGGVSPAVAGLAGLGTARRLADAALLACGPAGEDVVCLDGRVPAALVAGRPAVSAYLAADVFGPLLARDPADRALLVSTLDAWLECGGSAARAAVRLRCHRNTVLNRLRRLEELTSRSLPRPRELVEVALALDAVRLLPLGAVPPDPRSSVAAGA